MKLQPFNLELWLHLGKPDCVWTRDGKKVLKLTYHSEVKGYSNRLSGIVFHNPEKSLHMWNDCGESFMNTELFHPRDLMLHLEDKPVTFGGKKR